MEQARPAVLLAQPVGGIAEVEHRQLHRIDDSQRPIGRQVGQQHRGAGLLGRLGGVTRGLRSAGGLHAQHHLHIGGLQFELAFLQRQLHAVAGRAAGMTEIGTFEARAFEPRIGFG